MRDDYENDDDERDRYDIVSGGAGGFEFFFGPDVLSSIV